MNGRVYDPEIGRFLSADPMVQFPDSTQGYDRYQYVNNNPLSATDPSGYFVTAIWAIAVVSAKLEMGQLVAASIAGAYMGYIETGSVKGGLLTGITIYGGGNLTAELAAKSITPFRFAMDTIVLGGLLSEAGGGRFGDGALGAASGLLAGQGSLGKLAKNNVFVAAIVGGTFSEIGGGKFGNGAASAAFAFSLSYQTNIINKGASSIPRELLKRLEVQVNRFVDPSTLVEGQSGTSYDEVEVRKIYAHLSKLAKAQGDNWLTSSGYKPEREMFARVLLGKGDRYTFQFFHHERLEADLMQKYLDAPATTYRVLTGQMHAVTLSTQKNTSFDLYHPSVVRANPQLLNSNYPRY